MGFMPSLDKTHNFIKLGKSLLDLCTALTVAVVCFHEGLQMPRLVE